MGDRIIVSSPWTLLLVSFFLSFIFTPVARKLAFKLGMIDQPNRRKLHLTPIPLLGGLSMYLAFMAALILLLPVDYWAEIKGFLFGATVLIIVGTLDDKGLLHHQIKLLVAMPIAALILMASGVHTNIFSSFAVQFSNVPWLWRSMDYALTLVWIVGITAAFGILDHMDGLCAGIAAIASAFIMVVALYKGQYVLVLISAGSVGTLLGFLRWNFKPAKIFMGDGGAMFLGFVMASLTLQLHSSSLMGNVGWIVPVLILGLPIFDTTLVSYSRLRRGLIPFAAPGKDHTAHRISNLGLGQRRAVLCLYALGIALGLLAILTIVLGDMTGLFTLTILALISAVSIKWLERVPYDHQESSF